MSFFRHALSLIVGTIVVGGIPVNVIAQQARHVPAYDKAQTKTVLNRSVFYLPLFGAVYREKFAALVGREPGVRGVIIHNHGCGGMWGWETTVAQFYYREVFAVITPEFVTREGNKTGCPGGSTEEMLKRGYERVREGVYTAVNPARLDARGHDIEEVIRWVKTLTPLPIFLSGHSAKAAAPPTIGIVAIYKSKAAFATSKALIASTNIFGNGTHGFPCGHPLKMKTPGLGEVKSTLRLVFKRNSRTTRRT